jgi:hypothetical protein
MIHVSNWNFIDFLVLFSGLNLFFSSRDTKRRIQWLWAYVKSLKKKNSAELRRSRLEMPCSIKRRRLSTVTFPNERIFQRYFQRNLRKFLSNNLTVVTVRLIAAVQKCKSLFTGSERADDAVKHMPPCRLLVE